MKNTFTVVANLTILSLTFMEEQLKSTPEFDKMKGRLDN